MDKTQRIRNIKEKYESVLMSKKGVVGVATGYKLVNGAKTDLLCIICYVIKKLPFDRLNSTDLIPGEIEGVLTDVIESGTIKAF